MQGILNKNGNNTLMIAIQNKYDDIAFEIMKNNDIDINHQNYNKDNALILAVFPVLSDILTSIFLFLSNSIAIFSRP